MPNVVQLQTVQGAFSNKSKTTPSMYGIYIYVPTVGCYIFFVNVGTSYTIHMDAMGKQQTPSTIFCGARCRLTHGVPTAIAAPEGQRLIPSPVPQVSLAPMHRILANQSEAVKV